MLNYRDLIYGIETKVPLLNGKETTYINFDNAATTPVFKSVLKKVNDFLNYYSSIHRGDGFKSMLSTKIYENARKKILKFVNAPDDFIAIFYKNTSDALNHLSYILDIKKDDIILSSLLEHNSNLLPWLDKGIFKPIDIDEKGRLNISHLKELIKTYSNRIKYVVLSGTSNVTGHITPIKEISEIVHSVGAKLIIDGAQLVPHKKVDIKNDGIDFLAFSGHKMYAPFGIGVLIGKRDYFEGVPLFKGGGTVECVRLDRVKYLPPPENQEIGSPNVVGAVAIAEAINQLEKIGFENIEKLEKQLNEYTIKGLSKFKEVEVYGETQINKLHSKVGVIPFNIKDMPYNLISAILSYEYGIGVRSGCFCAQVYIRRLFEKYKGENFPDKLFRGLVRVSFGIYNTKEEVDKFIKAIEDIINKSYKGNYIETNSKQYIPKNCNIDYFKYFNI